MLRPMTLSAAAGHCVDDGPEIPPQVQKRVLGPHSRLTQYSSPKRRGDGAVILKADFQNTETAGAEQVLQRPRREMPEMELTSHGLASEANSQTTYIGHVTEENAAWFQEPPRLGQGLAWVGDVFQDLAQRDDIEGFAAGERGQLALVQHCGGQFHAGIQVRCTT